MTTEMEAADVVFTGEPFLLACDIKSISEWPVQVKTSTLDTPVEDFEARDGAAGDSMLEDLTLMPHDVCRDLHRLVPAAPSLQPRISAPQQSQSRAGIVGSSATVALGKFTIEWKRAKSDGDEDDPSVPFVKSTMTLPQISRESLPLSIRQRLPPYGTLRCPMPVRYVINNKTMLPQDLEIVIESSEGFMFSGHKQMTLRLLPFDSHELVYNLFPLQAGNVTLPRLHVKAARFPNLALSELFYRLLPNSIFILPSRKDGRDIPSEGSDRVMETVAVS